LRSVHLNVDTTVHLNTGTMTPLCHCLCVLYC